MIFLFVKCVKVRTVQRYRDEYSIFDNECKIPLKTERIVIFQLGVSLSRNFADFSARETKRPNNRPKLSETLSKFYILLALGVFNFFLLTVTYAIECEGVLVLAYTDISPFGPLVFHEHFFIRT